jgi:hypothetical protein
MARDWRTAEERSRAFDLPSVPFANPMGLLPEQYASMKDARRGTFGHFGIPLATLPEPVLGRSRPSCARPYTAETCIAT